MKPDVLPVHRLYLGAPRSYDRFIVTYQLNFVTLGIEDVERPPMDPGVFGGRDSQTQALQSRLLRFIIS